MSVEARWVCQCGAKNILAFHSCEACNEPRPKALGVEATLQLVPPTPTLWRCPISVCGTNNPESATRCQKCEAPRPEGCESCGKPATHRTSDDVDVCEACYREIPLGPGEVVNYPAPVERVNHPRHYNEHPSGVECIDIVEAFNFNVGNAMKYLWRAGLKGERVEDLRKAQWYVTRELERSDKAGGA